MSKAASVRRGSLRAHSTAIATIGVVLAVALALPAVVFAKKTLSNTKTFTLHSHTTKTYNVGYPAALKYGGAKYSCTATISGPGKSKATKILSKGSALGGSVCRVKARNGNKFEDPLEDVKIKVVATTTY